MIPPFYLKNDKQLTRFYSIKKTASADDDYYARKIGFWAKIGTQFKYFSPSIMIFLKSKYVSDTLSCFKII